MGCLPARAQSPLMQTRPTHVYIVDDSQPIRARLAHLLSSLPHVTVVGQAASASEAITGILRVKPDSVLLDLNLMGSTGIDVMRHYEDSASDVCRLDLPTHQRVLEALRAAQL